MSDTFSSLFCNVGVESPPSELLSRADFLNAIERLAGSTTADSFTDDLESVFLVCPYDTWKEMFGVPQDVVVCHAAVQAWEQPCSDGKVHCVGWFHDDPQDGRNVILMRVCFF